jgi:hypothetical protein
MALFLFKGKRKTFSEAWLHPSSGIRDALARAQPYNACLAFLAADANQVLVS